MTSVVLFSKDEAKRETAALKKAIGRVSGDIESVKERLAEADKREIWRALGYRSMAGYVTGELGMSRRNAYRTLDQVHAQLVLGQSVPRGTESDQLPALPTQRQAERIVAALKQARPKRAIPDKTSIINAVSTALDNYEAKSDGYEDEEIIAYLTHDERRALERAVSKASAFAERWGDLLTRPIERRYVEESA